MYSHYFEITKRPDQVIWAQLMLDVEKFFRNLPASDELFDMGHDVIQLPLLCGPMGDKKPICNTQKISFNGNRQEDMAHESFTLLPKKMSDYCKTDRKPYDFAVCAVLIIAYYHLSDLLLVRSDGDTDEWNPVLDWVRQHVLPDASLPPSIRTAVSSSGPVSVGRPEVPSGFFGNLAAIEASVGDFYFP
jgi:hypothetical protein